MDFSLMFILFDDLVDNFNNIEDNLIIMNNIN